MEQSLKGSCGNYMICLQEIKYKIRAPTLMQGRGLGLFLNLFGAANKTNCQAAKREGGGEEVRH